MAVTSAEVRSILNIHGNSTPAPTQPRKSASQSTRKPEGISRELYSLIGPSAPSLTAQLAKPRLKQKPKFGGGQKVKWEWQPFRNAGRRDNLELHHWVKANTDPEAEYSFAKYNVPSNVYDYSPDEYTRFLEDKDWSQEETDYLFQTMRDYDSRWFIVHDRYDFPEGVPRSLEDLKDRYYSVCRKLVRNRPWAGDEANKALLIQSLQFDKEREVTRKKYLASLENRTTEQIIEEEALYVEIKRLEQNERQFKKDRDELLRTLAGIDSGLPEVVAAVDEEGPLGSMTDIKRKKKGSSSLEMDSPVLSSNVISLGPPVTKRPQQVKNSAFDTANMITRIDPPPATTATKGAHTPVFLRSFKLPAPKQAMLPKMTQALNELGINISRLVMPTRENVIQLDLLIDATAQMLDTKKLVDKAEYDIKVLKARLGSRVGEGAATGDDGAMEIDEDENTDGRAQSVVSTRSGRSRKL